MKGDRADERGGGSRIDPTRLNNSLIIIVDTYEPATAPERREFACESSRPECADFAHRIGEIGESPKLLGRFSPSVQKLHRDTFSSAK